MAGKTVEERVALIDQKIQKKRDEIIAVVPYGGWLCWRLL